jgi:hypothetical protein
MKLTATQKRAKNYCDNINRCNIGYITVEWNKSKTWGSNPVISSHAGKMTNISGCGYCKLSTALADVLCFLFPVESPEFYNVLKTGGCGESAIKSVLLQHGWILETTSVGKSFDVFKLSRRVKENEK